MTAPRTPSGPGVNGVPVNMDAFWRIIKSGRVARAEALLKSGALMTGAAAPSAHAAKTHFGIGCCSICGVLMATTVGAPDIENACAPCRSSGSAGDALRYLALARRPATSALDVVKLQHIIGRLTDEQRDYLDGIAERGRHDPGAGPLPSKPRDTEGQLRRSERQPPQRIELIIKSGDHNLDIVPGDPADPLSRPPRRTRPPVDDVPRGELGAFLGPEPALAVRKSGDDDSAWRRFTSMHPRKLWHRDEQGPGGALRRLLRKALG